MNVFDRVTQKLALRWAKRQIDGARKEENSMLKLLDGNKRLVVVIGFIISGFVALLTGQDVSQWLDLGLRALGWTDTTIIASAKELATQIVPLLFALWAAVHGLWKMWKQYQAGATAVELNSPAGVIKAAVADGSLVSLPAPGQPPASTQISLEGVRVG